MKWVSDSKTAAARRSGHSSAMTGLVVQFGPAAQFNLHVPIVPSF
jgi:hypothetical protein